MMSRPFNPSGTTTTPGTRKPPLGFYRGYGKRLCDIVIATAGLILLSPVLAVVALAVRAAMGSPVLFTQRRAGLDGAPFVLWKFRTMTHDVDRVGRLLPDAQRLTSLGRRLRRWSLDELPELINVVKGDMSLVGPRPLPLAYVDRYATEQARRHEVRPGITGLTQVRGRNALSWADKFSLDVQYVERHSGWLDLKLLLATVVVVLDGRGVSQPGHATMEEFSGTLR